MSFLHNLQTCQHDGVISSFPTTFNLTDCRDKEECSAEIPEPPSNTSLELTGTKPSKEHEIQEYKCKEGFTLAGLKHELLNSETGKVEVPCVQEKVGNTSDTTFVAPTDWPTCQPVATECTELPTSPNGLKALTELPVAVGEKMTFSCSKEGKQHEVG